VAVVGGFFATVGDDWAYTATGTSNAQAGVELAFEQMVVSDKP
jgi:hypothetical protein